MSERHGTYWLEGAQDPEPELAWARPTIQVNPSFPLPIQYHQWIKGDEIKVKLMTMSKGMQWELTYEGVDEDAVIEKLRRVDEKLRELYGGE